jgi:hypothetical protein
MVLQAFKRCFYATFLGEELSKIDRGHTCDLMEAPHDCMSQHQLQAHPEEYVVGHPVMVPQHVLCMAFEIENDQRFACG